MTILPPVLRLGLIALALALPATAAGQAAGGTPHAARDIPRGVALQPADIEYREAGAPAGAGAEPGVVVGWMTRRVITAGEPLREPAIAPPALVEAGEEVQLLWRDGPVELRLRGRALNTAAEGERVTVRIDVTRRFEGVAVATGLVRLDSSSGSR